MSAIDNAIYHLEELDESRLAIPSAGKRGKIFKKKQDEGPNLDELNNKDGRTKPANVNEVKEDVDESN